nr:immunoglobulin light chain junction region [Macaca mulatta]MOX51380.1 immunoglobulin light chain junction region [Macaca mulatta]
CLQPLEFPPTF